MSIEVSEGGWDAPTERRQTAAWIVRAARGRNWCHLITPLLFTIFMSDMRFFASIVKCKGPLLNNRYLFHSKKIKEQK